ATNEVNQPHTFTVTVQQDTGSGFVPVNNAPVTVTLTPSNGATPNPPGPFNGNTDISGQFSVTFTSPTAGQVVGTATATISVGGGPVTISTDGTAGNSGPATKTFVDANIQITPATATNPVGPPHTLTVTVQQNDGSGAGFVPAPNGTVVHLSITSGAATF